METDLGRYHGSALQLLQKVRREPPLPAAELSGNSQGKPTPDAKREDQPEMDTANGPDDVKDAVHEIYEL